MQMFSLKSDSTNSSSARPDVDVRATTAPTPTKQRDGEQTQLPSIAKHHPVADQTVISNEITIEGNLTSVGKVCLEGAVEGDVRGRSVTVGEKGSVTGSILAEEVAVYGRVLGTVEGKNVMLYKSAHVEGDIIHEGIGIEMGTHYDGRLKWRGEIREDHRRPEPHKRSNGHEQVAIVEPEAQVDPFAAHRCLASER